MVNNAYLWREVGEKEVNEK